MLPRAVGGDGGIQLGCCSWLLHRFMIHSIVQDACTKSWGSRPLDSSC